jgi:hypothetical protein
LLGLPVAQSGAGVVIEIITLKPWRTADCTTRSRLAKRYCGAVGDAASKLGLLRRPGLGAIWSQNAETRSRSTPSDWNLRMWRSTTAGSCSSRRSWSSMIDRRAFGAADAEAGSSSAMAAIRQRRGIRKDNSRGSDKSRTVASLPAWST